MAADIIAVTGELGLEVFKAMEQVTKVSGNTFRCCEGMSDPEDLRKVMGSVLAASGKATASLLREIAGRVQTERWWTWILTHPDLGSDRIHHSRSVFCNGPCFACAFMCRFVVDCFMSAFPFDCKQMPSSLCSE